MKTLRYIGMAILAVVLCTNLSSCSDDDDSSNGNGNGNSSDNGMKISTITWNDGEWSEFFYDNQGRIVKEEDFDATGMWCTTDIEYNANNIVITEKYDDEQYRIICHLNAQGLVEAAALPNKYNDDNRMVQYTYDANGQLLSMYDGDDETETHFTWENGNLTKATNEGWSWTATYTYNTSLSSSQGFVFYGDVMIDIFDESCLELLANSGYFGKIPKNLLSGGTDNNYSWSLSYELSDDGYVSKITGTEDDETYWMTLTWK